MESNLSKTKLAFRTSGNVTGNFGAPKRKAGSKLSDVPANNKRSIGNFPTNEEYRQRLLLALERTTDQRLISFLQDELRNLDA